MDDTILKALTRSALFSGMTMDEIAFALSPLTCKMVKIGKKDIYMLAGYACRHVDIVVRGTLVARLVGLSGKLVEVTRMRVGYVLAPAFIFANDNRMPVSV